jgi:hypothetical protein
MSLENRFEMLEGIQQIRRRIIFATAVFQQPELLCQVSKKAKGLTKKCCEPIGLLSLTTAGI